jgi:D-alanyl-D-alanine carboxypeptidase
VHNINPILGRSGVIGVKPGWTSAAGSCLAFAARIHGRSGSDRTVYGVVLGQRGSMYGGAGTAATRLIDAARTAR